MKYFAWFFNLFELPFRLCQRSLGLSKLGWLFVAPNLLLFGIFTFLPIVLNVVYSVTGGVELLPSQRPLTGAENFLRLYECSNYLDIHSCREDVFWRAITNTLKFTVVQVALMVTFSLLTALVLNRKIVGRGFWRGVFFYPVLLSPVVVALIWRWLLQSQGVFNAVLVGVGGQPVDWLTDGGWAFFWTICVSIWAHMGFYTLILLAGLQAIPRDLYEAAEMDRASPWRVLMRITLPLLMPNFIVVLVLAMIRGVQMFDEAFVLTGGGPGSATTFIVQYIYEKGFAEQIHLYGLAAAASLSLAALLIVLTLMQLKLTRASEAGQKVR
ncbi:sugar ABC transporter permease (plasmid) [Burkholderia ubonensis]|uniref:Sugar ABC transporter permease n=1 Tax=Burkholderia ubonensis TaxID=101571 RepID=A0A124R9K3_9BURK|nr:sugar ABC transporter permease [Burkholderia ubonensis]AOJ64555.1 sugar ABC transporter permease [Burkholderia ubonensis]KVG61699.1 sugar ABC transporter permease [Burkholderia ubonensis]